MRLHRIPTFDRHAYHSINQTKLLILSKEDASESQAMGVDERSSESTPTKPPDCEKSDESPNKDTTPPKVAHVNLPLSLQFLRLAHEALGG